MMKSLAIVFFAVASASPFVYWLFRRRAGNGADRKSEERSPAPDKIIAEQRKTAALEVEATPDRPPLPRQQVETVDEATAEMEAGPVDGLESTTLPHTELEPDNSTYADPNAQIIKDTIGEVVPGVVVASADQSPSAELGQSISIPLSKPFPEDLRAAAVAEVPDLSGSGLAGEAKADVISPAAVADQPLQADRLTAACVETTVSSDTEEPPESDGGQGDAESPESAEESSDDGASKAPSRYRPPVQKPPRQVTKQSANRGTAPAASSEVTLDIRVRLTLDRFGFCAITFLPARTGELDDEVAVRLGTTSLALTAQEDWYQDLSFSDAGRYLHDGFELKGFLSDRRRARWILRGRDIYVLAAHPRASGFVSATRLAIGRSDIVLCGAGLAEAAEAVLKEAGCEGYSRLDETFGLPPGWAGFRGVSPVRAIALDAGTSDPFYAIKPAADIEIEFEAGIWLRNSVWLAGYPPQIKLFGQTNQGMKALIDGKEAQLTAEGSLVVGGYDLPGPHSVYCEGLSRSYSIEDPPDSWETWPAYQFGRALICGASVQLPPEESGRRAFSVPMSNPLLIGAEPGQVFRCSSRSVAIWKGFVPFDVVWALPAQPLTCNKKTARILQFSDKPLMPRSGETQSFAWSSAILDASRKGLRIDGGSPESAARWAEYRKMARNIWRSRR